jgi:two-component system sensor histidine kinase YesM
LKLLASQGITHNYTEREIAQAKGAMSLKMNTSYIAKEFYRVAVFNEQGLVATSNNYSKWRVTAEQKELGDIEWLPEVKGKNGRAILLGMHEDDWGIQKNGRVFSVAKEIIGMNMGFIEVQMQEDYLSSLQEIAISGTKVIVLNERGDLVYSNVLDENLDRYKKFITDWKDGVHEVKDVDSKDKVMIVKDTSYETGATIFLVDDMKTMKDDIMNRIVIAIFLAILFFLISTAFVYISSARLTKPIRQLQELMGKTKIENLNADIRMDEVKASDEMEDLYYEYQNTLRRLDDAIVKERKLSVLHLQAQMNTLQAQVNPHFLYNVLNVISNKGMLVDDESICDICDSLASILRYSTDTKEKNATINQELEQIEHYYSLLKARYEEKIKFYFDVPKEIREKTIPKMVLQQLVENSVEHGFLNKTKTMKVKIEGEVEGEGQKEGKIEGKLKEKRNAGTRKIERRIWQIAITDNGNGIDDETYILLEKKIESMHDKILNKTENIELKIGGMGLVNTYARLYLTYGENLIFEMKSSGVGTTIVIGERSWTDV